MAQNNNEIIPTQFMKKNFDLSEKIDEDFLNLIKDNFGEDVSVISLAILVNDSNDSKKELISFNYRNDKEQKNNEIIVDFSNPDSFDKVRKIL